jgi:hypothetical protein
VEQPSLYNISPLDILMVDTPNNNTANHLAVKQPPMLFARSSSMKKKVSTASIIGPPDLALVARRDALVPRRHSMVSLIDMMVEIILQKKLFIEFMHVI